jgi:alpha-galactosidase
MKLLLAGILVFATPLTCYAAPWNPGATHDTASSEGFVRAHIERPSEPPFAFTYAGKPFSATSPGWKTGSEVRTEARASIRSISYSDGATGLRVTAIYTVYQDFPAVEWVLRFKNEGKADTPIIEDVQACAVLFDNLAEGPLTLFRARGSNAERSDFAPLKDDLTSGGEVRFGPAAGRSSDTSAMPFFNIAGTGKGIVTAIGWSGRWTATVNNRGGKGVFVAAGMNKTHFTLHPGEQVRTPSIAVVFWKGDDRFAGHNLFRRFVLAHHTPRPGGQPLNPPLSHGIAFGGPFPCNEYVCATESYALASIDRLRQFGIEPEAVWIDAGWYEAPTRKWWEGVGNWITNSANFPRGLRPVADAAKAWGKGFVLWFEPERVYPGTRIDREHPGWLTTLPGTANRLFNLGNPDALKWLTDYMSQFIQNEGVTIYRQDFNFDPAPFWQAMDAADRVGIAEMKHIEGLYSYWDALLVRNPGLLIDNCASGGRRIDLETMGRSMPLWRTDYSYYEPNGYQCHTYGLHHFVPCSGTGNNNPQPYYFRSSMSGAVVMGWELNGSFDVNQAQEAIAEFRQLRPYFFGDFYPLTDYSTSDDAWAAFQWNRPEQGDGIVLAFRRPRAPEASIQIRLHNLDASARYAVTFEDYGITLTRTGAQLSADFPIKIPTSATSLLIRYKGDGPGQAQQ